MELSIQRVHLLWHTHTFPDGTEDDKLIGVYDSSVAAESAQRRVMDKPGFINPPDVFEISEYTVNEDHWQEGYTTVD